MTTPTHLSIGYIVANEIIKTGLIPAELKHSVITISMLSAILPDFDTLALWKIMKHRQNSPFHYPLFWLFVYLAVTAYFVSTRQDLMLLYTTISGINIFLHLIMDTFSLNEGIKWFYPFGKIEYNFLKVSKSDTFAVLFKRTIAHPMIKIEAMIWAIALILRMKSRI